MCFFKVGNTSPRLSSKSSEKSCRVFQVFLQSISSLIDWRVIIFETNADIKYLCHTFREAMLVICISCFPLSQVHRWIISSAMVLIRSTCFIEIEHTIEFEGSFSSSLRAGVI